jgi:hypothetical protein
VSGQEAEGEREAGRRGGERGQPVPGEDQRDHGHLHDGGQVAGPVELVGDAALAPSQVVDHVHRAAHREEHARPPEVPFQSVLGHACTVLERSL